MSKSSKEKNSSINREVEAFVREMDSDPSFQEEAIKKLAFWGDLKEMFRWSGPGGIRSSLRQYIPMASAAAATSAGLAGATGLAGKAYDAIRDSIMRARGYRQMVEEHGDVLQNVPADKAEKIYNTLYKFNPEFAADPMVAASFVRRVNELEGLDISEIKALVDARKTMAQTPDTGLTSQTFELMKTIPEPKLVKPSGPRGMRGASPEAIKKMLRAETNYQLRSAKKMLGNLGE